MAKKQTLSHPPIIEALIDIRVMPNADMTAEKFNAISQQLKETYQVSSQETVGIQFDMATQSVQTLPKQSLGMRIEGDGNVIQFQVSGFTFSRLKHYTTWESLVNETKQFWKQYKEASEPQKITRIATRYINRIDLQQPVGDLTRFLTAPPILPPNVPNQVANFFTRVTIVDEPTQVAAVIQQQIENTISTLVYVLDIDVFQQKDYDIHDDSFWTTLNQLRDLKNTIFFESITEETLNPYR